MTNTTTLHDPLTGDIRSYLVAQGSTDVTIIVNGQTERTTLETARDEIALFMKRGWQVAGETVSAARLIAAAEQYERAPGTGRAARAFNLRVAAELRARAAAS